jgi:sec-independent protein translocase protein TatA
MSSLPATIGSFFGPDLLIILLVILLLFGSAKIPQLMRGLGSGVHEFKKGIKEGETGAGTGEAKPVEAGPKPPAAPEAK